MKSNVSTQTISFTDTATQTATPMLNLPPPVFLHECDTACICGLFHECDTVCICDLCNPSSVCPSSVCNSEDDCCRPLLQSSPTQSPLPPPSSPASPPQCPLPPLLPTLAAKIKTAQVNLDFLAANIEDLSTTVNFMDKIGYKPTDSEKEKQAAITRFMFYGFHN